MWKMWLAICVCAASWAGGAAELGYNMSYITRSMQREAADLMEVQVNYSEPVIDATYVSTIEFDMRAMGALYNSTHTVIDFIANKQAYPEGLVSVSDGYVYVAPLQQEWKPLLAHYAGPTSVVVLAALIVAIMPLAGVFWCCCTWCRSGRRRRPFDRKYDACLKGMLAILLIALLTLFLFGVVGAFATESQLETGVEESPTAVRNGIKDARAFLNNTQAHARHLLVNNFRELKTALENMLTGIGVTVSVKLGEYSRAVSVTTLNKMVKQLDDVQRDLRTVHALTNQLRHDADTLNEGLRKVKRQLLQTLSTCALDKCDELRQRYNIGELDTDIHYNKMPDVTALLANVTALLDGNIKAEVDAGERVFRDIERAVADAVAERIPGVKHDLADMGRKLEDVADQITWLAGNASHTLQQQQAAADMLQQLHARYGPYRRYVGLGAACLVLLVTLILSWGLLLGVCGKRPDAYGAADCCNKGAGSRTLLCGICSMFIAGGLCAAVVLLYFVLGVAAQRFVCDPLTEPRGNLLFSDLEKFIDLEKAMYNERRDPNFNLTSVLVDMHRNHTIYECLQLWRVFNISSGGVVGGDVRRRVSSLRVSLPRDVTILRPQAREQLQQLVTTGLSDFNFDRILDALETNLTSLSLDSLSRQLSSTSRALPAAAASHEASALRAAAQHLATLHDTTVARMRNNSDRLNTTASRLRDGLRFNHSSLQAAVAHLLAETSGAETFFRTQGPHTVQNMTDEFAQVLARKVEEYVTRVEHAARHDVGRSAPLSHALNATTDALCTNVLMPVNGYWMSLSWCIVMLVPMMVVARRLARLYLHVDPYPGPLVEAEYLYDAYADRDNVPLANAYKAEKRAGRGARAGAGDGAGGGAGGGGRAGGEGGRGGREPRAPRDPPAPPLDSHHARRYNDMAPKYDNMIKLLVMRHLQELSLLWEEGPPRYHGPTEYERPPPYYYPGPNDRQ